MALPYRRALLLLATTLQLAAARAEETVRVSLTSGGGQGNGASGTGPIHAVAISGDGSKVVFVAGATNLVAGDTNGKRDVFVRDLGAGTTMRVSVSSAGVQGDDDSDIPRFSSNGRYVCFQGFSSTLVAGDTNGFSDVFVRDLTTNTTTRASVSTGGAQGNLNSEGGSLSADGRFLAFWSNSTNLVAGDTNATGDVFLRDRNVGTTVRVNVTAGGTQANANSNYPFLSSDATTLAFETSSTNLIAGDSNGVDDVLALDIGAGTFVRAGAGAQPNGASEWPSLSANGNLLAFVSSATNLVGGDTNGVADVFVQDLTSLAIERVSITSSGAQANGASSKGWISENGRYVIFESDATNLVTGDTNAMNDVFVHDRTSGITRRVSVTSGGAQANERSFYPAPSADAAEIAFGSHATNLVTGDTNSAPDVFFRSSPPDPFAYCFGASTACPCGNGGGTGQGCANSTGSGGELDWNGSSSAGADDLLLVARHLIPGQTALAYVGTAWVNNGSGVHFGDGLRCVGQSIVRFGPKVPNGQGIAVWGPGLGATGGWSAGDTRYFQVWYRNPVGGPCGTGFNLTNGLRVAFGL